MLGIFLTSKKRVELEYEVYKAYKYKMKDVKKILKRIRRKYGKNAMREIDLTAYCMIDDDNVCVGEYASSQYEGE